MDTIGHLENVCADAWPALVDQRLGQWRLRAAGGFTGRANSTLTTGDPGVPVTEALARTVTFAQDNGIKPAVHVTAGSPTEEEVLRAGWQLATDRPGGAESQVMTGPLPAGEPHGEVLDEPTRQWWAQSVGEPTPAQRHVLAGGPLVGFGLVDGAATVRGCVVGDVLHISRLAVTPEHRRRGLATALLARLGDWARQRGATRCVLQVAAHNTGAIRLYEGLGCTEHHRYRYLRPQEVSV